MILGNNPNFSYAQILLCAYHTDSMVIDTKGCRGYTRVSELWSFDTQSTYETLAGIGPMGGPEESDGLAQVFDSLFPGLRTRMWDGKVNDDYNNDPDEMHRMNLWLVQADRPDLGQIWQNLFAYVRTGPQGADDDTFDYWPSAWGVLLHFAEDLIALGVADGTILEDCQQAWDAIADQRGGGEENMASEIVSRPTLIEEAING